MNRRAYQLYSYIFFIAVYLVLTFLTTPESAVLHQYHLSVAKYRLILATVAVPLVIIWLVAYYGFAKLQKYSNTIHKNRDGKFVSVLTRGVAVLVFQLPITSAVSSVLNHIADVHPSYHVPVTIISHYVQLILPLVAFIFISYGARGLTELLKLRPSQRAIYVLAVSFIIIGAGFTYFVFNGLSRTGIASPANQAHYYIPSALIFFTLVVPYIFTWFIGLLAAYELYLYGNKVPGILYRRSWFLLSFGLGWVIFFSIFDEYLTTLSSHLTRLKVTALLLVVYLIVILLAVGYALLALGAKRLQKIEEV